MGRKKKKNREKELRLHTVVDGSSIALSSLTLWLCKTQVIFRKQVWTYFTGATLEPGDPGGGSRHVSSSFCKLRRAGPSQKLTLPGHLGRVLHSCAQIPVDAGLCAADSRSTKYYPAWHLSASEFCFLNVAIIFSLLFNFPSHFPAQPSKAECLPGHSPDS